MRMQIIERRLLCIVRAFTLMMRIDVNFKALRISLGLGVDKGVLCKLLVVVHLVSEVGLHSLQRVLRPWAIWKSRNRCTAIWPVLVTNYNWFLVVSLTLVSVIVAWVLLSIRAKMVKFLIDIIGVWLELNVCTLSHVHVSKHLVLLLRALLYLILVIQLPTWKLRWAVWALWLRGWALSKRPIIAFVHSQLIYWLFALEIKECVYYNNIAKNNSQV